MLLAVVTYTLDVWNPSTLMSEMKSIFVHLSDNFRDKIGYCYNEGPCSDNDHGDCSSGMYWISWFWCMSVSALVR